MLVVFARGVLLCCRPHLNDWLAGGVDKLQNLCSRMILISRSFTGFIGQ